MGAALGIASAIAAGAVGSSLAARGGTQPTPVAERSWRNANEPPIRRANELLARMTLDEKIAMVHGVPVAGTHAGRVPANPRLGIPELVLSDGPNGVGNGSTGVTAFPAEITDAAAFDPSLVYRYGAALGAEQAGKGHNVALAPTLNILRTPLWGRSSETYTEDPYLNAQSAAAEVRGIQSEHVIAAPKHFVANNQETGRFGSQTAAPANAAISERALQEIYYPAFRAAVQQGGAAAVMCSYPQVNGEYGCQSHHTLQTLEKDWNWQGFVVSDWSAAHDTLEAATAGLDLEMPLGVNFGPSLKQAVQSGKLPAATLDDMVRRILTAMFQVGLFDHPVTGNERHVVSTAAHRALAAQITEQGSVLLKNQGDLLPLDRARVRSIAVVGADASTAPQITEAGSGAVTATGQIITGLQGISARAGRGVRVTYSPGTLGTVALPVLSGTSVTPTSGPGHGLTGRYFAASNIAGAPVMTRVDPAVDVSGKPVVGLPSGWSARWTGTLTPPVTGDYRFSLNVAGKARLWLDGKLVSNVSYADMATTAQAVVHLTARHGVPIRLDYGTEHSAVGGTVHLGWQPPDDLRQRAVATARAADVAVVFVNDSTGEGSDRTSLALPGDQDQLVSAVAAANRNTVVVLNTSGPVLMPWLSKVRGVLESWYPGQQGGAPEAALLFGDASPSGRLPMTWPAGDDQGASGDRPEAQAATGGADEGVLVGYRWYDATGRRPLFSFGYGLSYSRFRYDDLRIDSGAGASATVDVRVTNTGSRTAADVVQLYVSDPPSAGEPPKQLEGYRKVTLRPGESRVVSFALDPSAFASWQGGWTVPAGAYRILVGRSVDDIQLSGQLRLPGP